MERYHILKLGLAILFYAAYCIRPMLVNGLRSMNKTEMRPEDYLVYYQVQDGVPGVDFPILSNIPRTTFSCQNIDSGYYADLDTDCQVFHICEEGKKISFLCPNGTIFDQSDLICEWWFKVNCSNSPSLYHESAELLREDLAKRKASRKVYLDGQERNHGAVMRVEESSSISARKGSKSFSPGSANAITNNKNTRISHDNQKIESPSQQVDHQKNKRYNDADTGNYVNKVNDGNLKDYHVQFSGTSRGLQTASSERHVRVRSTTPSSLNSVSSDQGQHLKNGSRGKIKFRPSSGTDEDSSTTVKSTDEYDLEFPKHRSEIVNENLSGSRTSPTNLDSTKVELGVQAELKGRPGLSTIGTRTGNSDRLHELGVQAELRGRPGLSTFGSRDSDELQVTQETAAFAKNSYNGLRSTTRKQPTVNPYPNHRPVYSDLKPLTLPTPRFLGSINSVTPQYITTQPINNGKPFVGSTVGVNIYGTKLRTTTLAPEISPFGRHISSTYNSIISTTQVPPVESSTKRIIDHATVYGTFKSTATTSTPPGEANFGNDENKAGIQLTKSVGNETPKYGSAVNPPLLKSDAVVHISDLQGTIPSSTVRSGISSDSDIFEGSTTASPKGHIGDSDNVVKSETFGKTYYPSTTTVNDVQGTTESAYDKSVSSSPKISTTEKGSFGYQSTTGSNSFIEGSTVNPPQADLAAGTDGQNSVAPEIDSEGGSGILLKPTGSDAEIKSGGVDNFSGTTERPFDVSQASGGSTLKPGTLLPNGIESTITPQVSNGDGATGRTAGISVGLSANAIAKSAGSASKIAAPSDGGTIYEVFTEPTDLSGGHSVGATATGIPHGTPFKGSQQANSDEAIGSTQLPGSQQGSTTAKPSIYQATHRGRPFKVSEEASEQANPTVGPAIYEVFTERTHSSTGKPIITTPTIDTVTKRGRPFQSSQYSSEAPKPTAGLVSIGSTHSPINAITHRGRPFKTSQETTEPEPTVGGHIYEVFTEQGQSEAGTTDPSLDNAVTLRGKPFKTSDSVVDSSEYTVSTENPQTSTGQPKNNGPFENSQSVSNVEQPSDNASVFEVSTVSSISPSNQVNVDGTTIAPSVSEVPKYGSAVNPPLLTPDAFVHVSDIKSTSSPIAGAVSPTGDNANLEVRSPGSESKLTYFVSSTAAPLKATTRTYGSTTVPPLVTKDSIVPVTDVHSTSRPTKDELVSNYDNEDDEVNKPSADDVNISDNAIGSTLAPDVVSFAGSLKTNPVVVPPFSASNQNSISLTVSSHGGKGPENPGFYVTKNSVYDSPTSSPPSFSSTISYERSTPFVNVIPHSGGAGIEPPQGTLSAPKVESSFEKEVPLAKSESQWPRPFQTPNNLRTDNKERATYLPTESTTSAFVTYQISSARPFMLPEGTSAPTVPSPFTSATPPRTSVYENVDNMINILKEIVNSTDHDYSSETPRPGLIVPPSAGPQTLHTLAVYFANALDGIAAEREKLTGEELDEESKEKLTSLLTQMTMYRYKELFKGREEEIDSEGTTVATDLEDDSENLIQAPGLKQLARNFSLALSSYLDDPETFRKDLESLRPTEPPELIEGTTEPIVNDEELLNFSDADAKPSFPPAFSTLPSVSPTWGYILAPKGSEDLDVKNSLNPDLHTADTQSFVPGFNNLPASVSKSAENSKKGLPEDHWTVSPGATKLWQSAFSVNPAIVNEHFITTEPTLLEAESTDGSVEESGDLPRLDIPQSEVRYDLRALPKISVNTTEVRGLLIDFINTTKSDESNRLQRLLRKLNTTENEFLSRMKEIESNPLTKRLVLLLISECGTNATKDIAEQELSKETLESSQTNSAVASYNEGRQNSDIPELVDSSLQHDDQDTRALQLLNSLYTIAAKFGK